MSKRECRKLKTVLWSWTPASPQLRYFPPDEVLQSESSFTFGVGLGVIYSLLSALSFLLPYRRLPSFSCQATCECS